MKRGITELGVLGVVAVFVLSVSCESPLQAAKTAMIFAKAGTEMAQTGFDAAKDDQEKKCTEVVCLKLDPNKGAAYQTCMAEDQSTNTDWKACWEGSFTKKALDAWTKLKPELWQAWKTADSVIAAAAQAEDGKPIDYMTPIKHGACLLAKASVWLPEKWKAKIQGMLNMMETFTCGSDATVQLTRSQALYVLKMQRKLMGDMLAQL